MYIKLYEFIVAYVQWIIGISHKDTLNNMFYVTVIYAKDNFKMSIIKIFHCLLIPAFVI